MQRCVIFNSDWVCLRRTTEADGNRTHQSRLTPPLNGFEDRGAHQDSITSMILFLSSEGGRFAPPSLLLTELYWTVPTFTFQSAGNWILVVTGAFIHELEPSQLEELQVQ